jgi:hypothetical protein
MIRFIEWDDESDAVKIHDNGRREPHPGELNRLAQIIDIKPKAMTRLDVLAVLFVFVVGALLFNGGGQP